MRMGILALSVLALAAAPHSPTGGAATQDRTAPVPARAVEEASRIKASAEKAPVKATRLHGVERALSGKDLRGRLGKKRP